MQPEQHEHLFINGGMDEKDMVHVYNGLLLSHKKKNNTICSNMGDLKTVILSEVSQTQKDKHDITYMWNLKKRVQMYLHTKQM